MDKRAYQNILGQLNFRRTGAGLYKHLLIDALLLGLAFVLSREGICGALAAGLLVSAFMFRSFSLMHEAVHLGAHTSRRLNDWVGHLYGACSFLPYSQWKEIHLQHHLWAGNLEMDPTMKIIKIFKDTGRSPTAFQEFAWRNWLPYLAFRQQLVFWQRSLAALKSAKPKVRATILIETGACAGFVLACAFGFGPLTAAVAVLGYLALVELINFPHHTGLTQDVEGTRLAPADQHKIARSVIYTRWFNRHVLLNFNYHVEHHLFPTLPWRELESAHAMIKGELGDGFNLSRGNEWLIASRKMSFREILVQSTRRKEESLEKPKLVL